jgi:hypothetical protein
MGSLTLKEQEIFRKDLQDKEREIQRYIGVYLSGLVLVTGWIIGPQSRPLVVMALGNNGYNVFAFLVFVALNVLFINFLIYKSILIHEIAQFIAYLSEPESGFLYWESWRRSPQSASRRVRTTYTVLLAVLPISVSFLIMFGLWKLLHSDPQYLAEQYRTLQQLVAAAGAEKADVSLSPQQIGAVFSQARTAYWAMIVLHAIPFWFIFENVVPTNRRWDKIHRLRASDTFSFKDLSPRVLDREQSIRPVHDSAISLVEKQTGVTIAQITSQQLRFLIDNLQEEYPGDQDYYIQRATIDLLKDKGADDALLKILRDAVKISGGIEIRWEKS